MKIHVANIIEEGKLGGPQVRMVRVAAALDGRAETLIVMPRANSDAFRALCGDSAVSYRMLPLTRITREWRAALAYCVFSPWEVLRLAWLLRRESVDIVHASGGSWQYKAVLAARVAGIPSVWHLNDSSTPGWVRRLFALVQRGASGFIFASYRSRDYYGDYGDVAAGRPHAIVPSTVDAEHFDPRATLAGDETVLQELDGFPVIGTVANINRVKGIETLIRAAAELRASVPDLRVVVIGPVHSNQTQYFRDLCDLAGRLGIADRIHWVGARTDVRPLLRRLDVYVCSSLAESSPVSVWEAMAMARPVVSTDVGDVSRHVRDGDSGFVVPTGDHAAIADRVSRLLDSPALRSRIGAAAREAARAEFTPKVIAGKTLDIYRRVLEDVQPRRRTESRHGGS